MGEESHCAGHCESAPGAIWTPVTAGDNEGLFRTLDVLASSCMALGDAAMSHCWTVRHVAVERENAGASGKDQDQRQDQRSISRRKNSYWPEFSHAYSAITILPPTVQHVPSCTTFVCSHYHRQRQLSASIPHIVGFHRLSLCRMRCVGRGDASRNVSPLGRFP